MEELRQPIGDFEQQVSRVQTSKPLSPTVAVTKSSLKLIKMNRLHCRSIGQAAPAHWQARSTNDQIHAGCQRKQKNKCCTC